MSARMDRLEFYRADDDFVYDSRGLEVVEFKANHRWRLVAAENGRTIAASTESYRRRIAAVTNAARVLGLSRDVLAMAVSIAAQDGPQEYRGLRRLRVVVVKP